MHAYIQGTILLHVKHCRNAKIVDHVHMYPQQKHISAMAEAAGDSRHVQSVLMCMQGLEWAHVHTRSPNPPPLELHHAKHQCKQTQNRQKCILDSASETVGCTFACLHVIFEEFSPIIL